ncbi:hypothetical protein D5F52_13225 [Brevibacillus laterosporus]|nr:hypothetical protein D5F52_13225 [Brevibacillus laterosporus]MBM7109319.1 hypothetical protein [Brevibacillus laterosporus]
MCSVVRLVILAIKLNQPSRLTPVQQVIVPFEQLIEAIKQQDADTMEVISCSYMITLKQVLQDAWGGDEKK